jgi:hypothetical protein
MSKKEKTCLGCFERKEIKEFDKHPSTIDGHVSLCKNCKQKEIVKQNKTK